MPIIRLGKNLYQGECPVREGEVGELLAQFKADIVVGHPTFRNAGTIGRELAHGLNAATAVFPDRNVAFIVSDGTYRLGEADDSTLSAALQAAGTTLRQLSIARSERLMVAAVPYDGYQDDRTPGKGSALKLLFEEVGRCPSMTKLILLDGDLRNELKPWFAVFQQIQTAHRAAHKAKDFFITARYARHFVDASLTRFVVGPLTTLMGEYVPGGISGDIVLSAGAVRHERNADWDEHRRRYGTDIATTLDNIADPDVVIYEAYLGAKLHDITDDSKLSVMPGEVIGAALGRMLYYENAEGRLRRVLQEDLPLKRPVIWEAKQTGIAFTDPGFTNVFDVDVKRRILVDNFSRFEDPMRRVLLPTTFTAVKQSHSRLRSLQTRDSDAFEFMGMTRRRWIDVLYQSMAYLLVHGDPDVVKRCLNYLYTAAFLEFCREKIMHLGAKTLGDVRRMQVSLGVPPDRAQQFYQLEVDRAVEKMALEFYAGRRKILKHMESRPNS